MSGRRSRTVKIVGQARKWREASRWGAGCMLGGLRRRACRLWVEGTASRLDADRGRHRPRSAPRGHDLRDVARSDVLPMHAMRRRPRPAGTSCASMLMVPAIMALKAGTRIGDGLPFLPVCTHRRREVGKGSHLDWVSGASSEKRHSSLRAHAVFRSRGRAPCTACASWAAAMGRERIRGVARSGQGSGEKALPASLPVDVVLLSGRETLVTTHAFFSPSLTFRSRLVRHVSDGHAGAVLDSARRFPGLRLRNGVQLQGFECAMNALVPMGDLRMGHTGGVIPGARSGEMIAGRWRRAHSVAEGSVLRPNVLDGFIARGDRSLHAQGLLRPYRPAMRSRPLSLKVQGACVSSAWRVRCPPNAAAGRFHPLATRPGIRSTLHHGSAVHAALEGSNLPVWPHRSREDRPGRVAGGTLPSTPGRLTDVGQRDVVQSQNVGRTPVVQLSQTNHFHIVQQPGQDAAGLAEEIRRRLQVQSRSLMFDRMGA